MMRMFADGYGDGIGGDSYGKRLMDGDDDDELRQ